MSNPYFPLRTDFLCIPATTFDLNHTNSHAIKACCSHSLIQSHYYIPFVRDTPEEHTHTHTLHTQHANSLLDTHTHAHTQTAHTHTHTDYTLRTHTHTHTHALVVLGS